jgi:hypothetical protein
VCRHGWLGLSKARTTASNPVLAKLITTINNGWHESLKETDPELQIFFNFREQLIVQDDIVFKGEKIVVPSTLRSDHLNQIHQGHPCLEAMKNRVCDIFYWPALSRDVELCCCGVLFVMPTDPISRKSPLRFTKFQYDLGLLLHPISSHGTRILVGSSQIL